MKKIITLSVLLCAFMVSMAQVTAWQFGVPASLGNEVTYNATTTAANSAVSVLSRGVGVTASALAKAFSASNFTASGTKANAILNNQYFAFSMSANPGYQMSLSTLDVKIRRSGTGPNMYIWQYSTNGINFFDIGADISYNLVTSDGDVQPQIDLSSIPALQNVLSGTIITFRLYAWGASALGGTFAIGRYGNGITTNSLAIGGTVTVPCVAFPVTIASNPISNIICEGASTILTATGGVTYVWNPGNISGNPVTLTPLVNTTYTVIASDANNCTSTSSVTINVISTPAPTNVTALPNSFCGIGGLANLNATSAGNNINWYTVPSGGVSIGTSASGANFGVTPAATTTYYAEAQVPAGGTQTYSFTGAMQTFTVPAGISSLMIEAWGAQGGANWVNNINFGGYSKGTFAVTPGETLNIYVGGQATTITGGFNGGGNGEGLGKGGGGASDVRQGGTAFANRIIVGGGGGGAGFWNNLHVVGGVGGGGGLNGGDGYRDPSYAANPGGQGGTQVGSGNGTCISFNNPIVAGGLGFGGAPAACGCEGYGGGGGLYGGAGSGNCRGAGGGSGYLAPGATGTLATSGIRVGNGQIILTWSGTGCASLLRTPVIITVNPSPLVTASASPAAICPGGSSVLTGGGAATYTWNPGALVGSPTVTPAATTIYSVVGTDGNGCTGASTVEVTVYSSPVVTASASPAAICPGSSSVLTGGGAATYAWNPGALVGSPTVTPAATTTYSVVGTDGNGCTGASTVEVTLYTSPVVTASASPATICPGGSSVLTGGGAATYAWDPGALVGSPTVTPAATTTYSVVGTDGNGCTGASTVEVTLYTSPVVTASATPPTICEGLSSMLMGSGAATYLWNPGALVGMPTVTPLTTTTYSVTGTDGNGCTGTTEVTVTVNPAPIVIATATPSTTCAQTTVTPSASGAATIGWSGGLLNNVAFIATATTTYTVTGTDGLGCNGTTTVLVTVNPMSGVLAPATSNQSQDQGDDFNINYYDASCNLIATVDDGAGGNILGLTTSTVTVLPGFGVHNGQPYVQRWYQITPTNNGSADVILYFTQAEFNDYNAGVALPYLPLPTGPLDASGIANVRITKNADAGLGNTPIVITPTVTWNALNSYWELSFNTPGFSQFRVHSVNPGNIPLPATVTYFSGMKLETSDKLSWTTSSEQNNAYFNLQHGTDGTNFTTLARVDSKAPNGNSAVTINYSAENAQPNLGHNYYRLQQVDMDGKVSVHAQIVDLIWGANGSTVSIYPNPTTDILNIDLYASNAQNTTVKLLDMSGRVIKQIQAKSAVGMNHIKLSMGEIASGVYTIQVYENNSLTHTSKVKKN